MKLTKKLTSLLLAIVLCLTLGIPALAAEDTPEMDEETAVTVALLFVLGNIGNSQWDMTTTVDRIVPMYDNNETVSAYLVQLKTSDGAAGYVIVSADLRYPLIAEYSDDATAMVCEPNQLALAEDEPAAGKIYYYGPMNYGTEKRETAEINAERNSVQSQENFRAGAAMVRMVQSVNQEAGYSVQTTTPTGKEGNYIYNPLEYLKSLYPASQFQLLGSASAGETSVTLYTIAERNACAVYATAAVIKFHLGSSYSFSSIVNYCLSYAETGGYARRDSDGVMNYYMALGKLQPFARACCAHYGLNLNVTSMTFTTFGLAKGEIQNGRPCILNIASSDQYADHSVTAFAWASYLVPNVDVTGAGITYDFFKVVDGYDNPRLARRYVNWNSVTVDFITYFRPN